MENAIKKSGIGRAFYHQKKALTLNNIEFTTNKNDLDYDILHINTIYPDSLPIIKQARENNKKLFIMRIVQKKILKIHLCFQILLQVYIKMVGLSL